MMALSTDSLPMLTLPTLFGARGSDYDGPKWTCGVQTLQRPCVIFSLGSNDVIDFETEVRVAGAFSKGASGKGVMLYKGLAMLRDDGDGRPRIPAPADVQVGWL
jgi:hypothetical protein